MAKLYVVKDKTILEQYTKEGDLDDLKERGLEIFKKEQGESKYPYWNVNQYGVHVLSMYTKRNSIKIMIVGD